MPLPLIPIFAAAALIGAFGVKKGIDAYDDNEEADSLRKKAQKRFARAKKRLERARERCNSDLESLGQLRLELWQRQIGRFVSLFSEFRDVEFPDIDRRVATGFSEKNLEEMRTRSSVASDVLMFGVSSLGSGALAGVAAYGAVTMLASASTGTAISTLSGVAATNATLAWFGGGSLAAGGLGIAGSAAVLGGIVAAPVLAVGGMLLAAKARENLANAKGDLAEAKKAASEMKNARAIVKAIIAVVCQVQEFSKRLDDRFTLILDDLEAVVDKKRKMRARISFGSLALSDQHTVHNAWLFAQVFQGVLDLPLLTKKGALSKRVGQSLDAAKERVALLEQREDSGA